MAAIQLYLDGPLLSSIFYDNSCCGSVQEGFITGQIKIDIKDTVNDAQINNRTEKVIIVAQNICAVKSQYSFYTNTGEILMDKLQSILGEKCEKVIGWFRARRNSPLEPTFLERTIHYNLRSMTDEENNFLFLIFTTQNNKLVSTHTFDHICLRTEDGLTYDTVPISILNLGNSSQEDYKRNVIETSGSRLVDNPPRPKVEPVIQIIRTSIESKLQQLCLQVSESETECSQLEKEVQYLCDELERQNSSGSTFKSAVNILKTDL